MIHAATMSCKFTSKLTLILCEFFGRTFKYNTDSLAMMSIVSFMIRYGCMATAVSRLERDHLRFWYDHVHLHVADLLLDKDVS